MLLRRNPRFERELLATPQAKRSLELQARRVAGAVQQASETFERTGTFRQSISTDGAQVTTSDPFWHLIELGSVNNPAYAPFRRGIRAAGLAMNIAPKP